MPSGEHSPRTTSHPFCDGITEFLLTAGCKAIVVACNTASAAALKHLRERFPHLPLVGLEPAVKPAAAITRSGVIGVMATPATFQGRLYQATVGRHAAGVKVIARVCAGLAELVEAGHLDDPDTDVRLKEYLQPILDAGADTIVLGCTHYPFVRDDIARVLGDEVMLLDTADAVAAQAARLWRAPAVEADAASCRLETTGDPQQLRRFAARWLGIDAAITPTALTL